MLELNLDVTNDEAMALAQLVKRIGWVEVRNNAVDKEEAYVMIDAVLALQKALAKKGYAPR